MEHPLSLWRRARNWVSANPFWIDLAGALTLFVVLLPFLFGVSTNNGPWGLLFTNVITLCFVVPLAFRRTRPVLSVALIYSAGLFLLITAQWSLTPSAFAVPVALYSVTLHGPRWAYRTALLSGFVGIAWFVVGSAASDAVRYNGSWSWSLAGQQLVSSLFFTYMFFLTVWAIALMRRSRRDLITGLMDRAARLEIERDQQHQIATAAERTRIAREMHDIVAHSLSVIIAQADGGQYAAEHDPAAAQRVLGTIAETGRDALSDMRRLLGVLRPDVGSASAGGSGAPSAALRASTPLRNPAEAFGRSPGTTTTSGAVPTQAEPGTLELTPQPASGDLDGLIDQVRASGLRISLVRLGTARPLPPGMGLSVFRICQESLTNILKHAGPNPTVTIVLRWEAESLSLEVTDDGRGAAADSDGLGHGVLGMGERATMFGGTLTSGPRPGGGFRVHLQLPIPALQPDPPIHPVSDPQSAAGATAPQAGYVSGAQTDVVRNIPIFSGPLDPPSAPFSPRGTNL